MRDLADCDATEISRLLARREVTSVEVVDALAERIAAVDGELRAFVALAIDRARHEARASDERRRAGRGLGALDGVPFAVKDLFDVAGDPTPAGSGYIGPPADEDAAAVAAMRGQGAVLVGRTNMDELAYGMTSWPTRNARDPGRAPGGSSGGSAVAVASGEVPLALGSDTGGSVQVPAALNGIVGFKPGHGVISTAGTTVLSPTLDHVGVFARRTADVALAFAALAPGAAAMGPMSPGAEGAGASGVSGAGAASAEAEFVPPAAGSASAAWGADGSITLGVPDGFFEERIAPGVGRAYRDALARLETSGVVLTVHSPPLHERYGEIEEGICVPEFAAAQGQRVRAHPEAFREISRRWAEVGSRMPAEEYNRALEHRGRVRREWLERLGAAEAVITPMAPITAPPYGARLHTWPDGVTEELDTMLGRFANIADITGFPSISLPAGSDENGLPVGIQLVGRPGGDARLLALAARLEPIFAG